MLSPEHASILVCALFCILVGSLAAIGITHDYRHSEELVRQRLAKTTDLVAQWMVGAFHASDYLLRDMADQIDPETLRYPHPNPQAQRRLTDLLIAKKNTLPHAFLVGAFNRDCIVTHTNAIIGFNASGRAYCRILRDNPDAETLVTPAFKSNLGHLNVVQARRLDPDADEFRGMVAIGIDLAYFSRLLKRIDAGQNGNVTILDTNGLLLARKPHLPEAIGQQVTDPLFLEAISNETEFRDITGPSPIDDTKRLFGIRKVPDLPFVVIIGEARREMLANWFWRMVIGGAMVTLLWLLAGLFLHHHLVVLRQRTQLAHLANHDPLTGIFNRRHFEQLANLAFKRASRMGAPLSLLLLDLNRFKQINDQHGHATGDRALLAFVDACRLVLRETDLFSRWGGDEFAVLIDGDDADSRIISKRLREAWTRIDLQSDHGTPLSVTASIGVASTAHGAAHSLEQLFSHADDALYREKQSHGSDPYTLSQQH